jgi:hypothetical protein
MRNVRDAGYVGDVREVADVRDVGDVMDVVVDESSALSQLLSDLSQFSTVLSQLLPVLSEVFHFSRWHIAVVIEDIADS